MLRKNLIPLIGIALVVALASTGIFYGLMAGRISHNPAKAKGLAVVVAARNMAAGEVLKAEDVRMADWGTANKPEGALSSRQAAVGQVLLQSVSAGEVLTQGKLGSSEGAGSLGVPVGMRAVSITAADSAGVLGVLASGHRVDVLVVVRDQGGFVVRNILQNLQVLNVRKGEGGGRSAPIGVVTLLATPPQADLLALADAAGKIRLLLRNPVDQDQSRRNRIAQAVLLDNTYPAAPVSRMPVETVHATARQAAAGVSAASATMGKRSGASPHSSGRLVLAVRILGAGGSALRELTRDLAAPAPANSLQVTAYTPGADIEQRIRRLAGDTSMRLLSEARLSAGHQGVVSVEAGAESGGAPDGCGIRVQFTPSLEKLENFKLRVEPEVSAPAGEGIATHRIRADLDLRPGQSFLISGLSALGGSRIQERLFRPPGAEPGTELVVVVTAQRGESWQSAGLYPEP